MVKPTQPGPVRIEGPGTTRLETMLARFAPPPKTQSEHHRRCTFPPGPLLTTMRPAYLCDVNNR